MSILFVAEIGMNHEGNFDLAYELIRKAKNSGAHIAKFQLGWRDGPGEINCIDLETAQKLKNYCEFCEIEFMASIISRNAFELAQNLNINRYKIASRTVIDDPELCQDIINEGKEVFCSLGFWDKEEFPFGPPNEKLHYIFCKSSYPMMPEHLGSFPKAFQNEGFFGYSDHFLGNSLSYIAIARGAKFIEKHFTLNKASQTIRDHTLSITPDEFTELVRVGSEIHRTKLFLEN